MGQKHKLRRCCERSAQSAFAAHCYGLVTTNHTTANTVEREPESAWEAGGVDVFDLEAHPC